MPGLDFQRVSAVVNFDLPASLAASRCFKLKLFLDQFGIAAAALDSQVPPALPSPRFCLSVSLSVPESLCTVAAQFARVNR